MITAVPECLDGYDQADLVSVLEAVGNGLGWGMHMYRHALDLVFLNASAEG